MCAIGAPGRSALLPSRALAGAAAAAAGAAPPRTALARGLPALRRLDHLAVDPAGARTRPAAAGALAPPLLRSPALGAIPAAGASATAAGAAAAATPAALAATASTTAAGGLPTAARAVRTAQVLELLGLQALAGAGALGQRALRLAGDVEIGEQVLRGRVGLPGLGGLQPQLAGDEGPAREVLLVHERDRGALLARTAGAAGAVEVGLVVVRAVPVHHVGDVGDVDAAGGVVGRDQHVDLAVAE